MTSTWKRTRLETVREYEIPRDEVPDLQDSSVATRMVIRPWRVKIYQVYGSNLARGAVIEGRMVRRDGTVAGPRNTVRQICVGHNGFYDAEPPAWLNKLIENDGLVWLTDRETVSP